MEINNVWTVEVREYNNGILECTLSYIASTKEKAVEWLKSESPRYVDGTSPQDKIWWWFIQMHPIDRWKFKEKEINSMEMFDKNGKPILSQPINTG